MITVNSISGGKTSCFMALEFQAEYNLFALVEQDAYKAPPEARWPDAETLAAFNWVRKFQPGFWATAEDNKTLVVLHKLWQELEASPNHQNRGGFNSGLEIVCAGHYTSENDTFDKVAKWFLPNAHKRLCTQLLKLFPIYQYCKRNIIDGHYGTHEPVKMNIGFRLDEVDRTVNLYFKLVEIKKRVPNPCFDMQSVINDYGIPDYIVKWWDRMDVDGMVKRGERILKPNAFNYYDGDYYRVPAFPLIEAGVTHAEIIKYWKGKPEYNFPEISNCVMCFHHRIRELQKQWQNPQNIAKMLWAEDQEKRKGKTFLKRYSMTDIKNMPVQTEIDFSDWTSCDAGSCTD